MVKKKRRRIWWLVAISVSVVLFAGYVLRTRTNLQFTRELFLRVVVQYNDFSQRLDVEPLLTYKPARHSRPGP